MKPLLAGKAPEDLSTLQYPVLVSPKLDGIRALRLNGRLVSRNLKDIPNNYVRGWCERNLPDGLDGELLLRDWTRPFAEVTSAIMSQDGEPDFVYACFDYFGSCDPTLGFVDRFSELKRVLPVFAGDPERAAVVPHDEARDVERLQSLVRLHVELGYEGSMVRSVMGRYKFGRSTEREGILLKIKAFADEEATVDAVEEEMENQNAATVDNLGRTKRSTAKDGKVGKGRLGSLRCYTRDGAVFNIGSGFTEQQRITLWSLHLMDGKHPIGQRVKFKHQPPPGGRKPGEAPRFPIFLGFRHEADA